MTFVSSNKKQHQNLPKKSYQLFALKHWQALRSLDEKFDTELFSDFSAKTLEGSFSAVSTPSFASKYSFCNVFRDLQDCHTFAPLETKKIRKFSSNFFFAGGGDEFFSYNISNFRKFVLFDPSPTELSISGPQNPQHPLPFFRRRPAHKEISGV